MITKLICFMFGHKRRQSAIVREGGHYRSCCHTCGTPLVRHGHKKWKRVSNDVAHHA